MIFEIIFFIVSIQVTQLVVIVLFVACWEPTAAAPLMDPQLQPIMSLASMTEPGVAAEIVNYRNQRGLGLLLAGSLLGINRMFDANNNGNNYGGSLFQPNLMSSMGSNLYNPYAYYGLGNRPFGNLGTVNMGYMGR